MRKVQHVDQVVRLPPGAVHEPLAEGICVDSQEPQQPEVLPAS